MKVLDLFCGAGGCAKGYADAGFEVVGVDVNPQPNYPFEFHQGDALETDARIIRAEGFDAVHASPPCQDYSRALRHMAAPQPRLIEPVMALLEEIGLPWVIENVVGAPIPTQDTLDGRYGVELCGSMFGLRIQRHRLFESSFPIQPPGGCRHHGPAMNPHNVLGRERIYEEFGKELPVEAPWRKEMGVEWMTRDEAREAVPPAYTEHIGGRLVAHLEAPLVRGSHW